MVSEIVGIVGSAASGGLLGLAGTGIQALLKYFEVREERKTQIALRELDIRKLEIEYLECEFQIKAQVEHANVL
ncbi:MAG: hypothetical protein K1563_13895 [Candidatus Thiodiazotropha sp. (ex. Lucinisca nassula)]|nr:hypothetical protein [Candidatus Thiodiazotropha sp. (ex. Lucinisca nassula)]